MDEASPWLVANLDLLPVGGVVLDVACGSGRHATFLARRGWRVHAVDRDAAALDRLRVAAAAHAEADAADADAADADAAPRVGHARGVITTECRDLETGPVDFGHAAYAGVIVFRYLHRPLMPALVDAVAPGGVLIYETFTVDQARRGHPRNPAFLLASGELPALVAPLRVVRAREGVFNGQCVASVVAMR